VAAPPLVQSFLIADSVIQDRATGKWSVIGVFDRLFAPSFPCVHPSLAVYIKLSDAFGRYEVRIEFRDAQDRCVSAFQGVNVDVKERPQTIDFGVLTRLLPLEKPGRYQFQLYLNGEYAASVPLEVLLFTAPPPSPA
jgi:hypothetical protein